MRGTGGEPQATNCSLQMTYRQFVRQQSTPLGRRVVNLIRATMASFTFGRDFRKLGEHPAVWRKKSPVRWWFAASKSCTGCAHPSWGCEHLRVGCIQSGWRNQNTRHCLQLCSSAPHRGHLAVKSIPAGNRVAQEAQRTTSRLPGMFGVLGPKLSGFFAGDVRCAQCVRGRRLSPCIPAVYTSSPSSLLISWTV